MGVARSVGDGASGGLVGVEFGGADLGEGDHERPGGRGEAPEAVARVERDGAVVDGVNDDCAHRDLVGCAPYAGECVGEQHGPEPLTLVALVDGEPREDGYRDREVAR